MSRFPLEGNYVSPRRASRSASPSTAPNRTGVGYGSADLPFTNQFFSRGERIAEQLDQALQGLGGLTARAGAIRRREVEEREALDENARKQLEIVEEGQAVDVARLDLAELADKVQKREIGVPLTHTDIANQTDDFIETKTQGFSEVKKAAYVKMIRGKADGLLNSYMEGHRAFARGERLSLYATSLAKESSAEGIQAAVDAIASADPTVTENERYAPVLDLARAAAIRGRAGKEQLDAALSVLGDRYIDDQERAKVAYRQAENAHEVEAVKAFNNDIAKMYIDEKPDDAIMERIQQYLHRKAIPASAADNQVAAIRARAERRKKELDERIFATEKAEVENAFVGEYAAFMLNGNQNYGAAALEMRGDNGFTVNTKSGNKIAITGADNERFIKAGVQQAIGQIEAVIPDGPLREAAVVRLLAHNDKRTNPAWSVELSGVFSRLGPDVTPEAVALSVRGLDRFRSLGSQNTEVRDRHTPPADREPLRWAQTMVEKMGVAPVDALRKITAVRGTSLGDSDSVHFDEASIRKLRKAAGVYANSEAIFDEARLVARASSIYFGATPEVAIDYALNRIKEDYTKIGNNMVHTVGRPYVRNIDGDAVSEAIIGQFKQQNIGFKDADLTLDVDGDGSWTIKDGFRPVGAMPLSDENMHQIDLYIKAHDEEKAKAERMTAHGKQRKLDKDEFVQVLRAAGALGGGKVMPYLAEKGYSLFVSPPAVVDPAKPARPQQPGAMIPILDYIDSKRKSRGYAPVREPSAATGIGFQPPDASAMGLGNMEQ